MFWPFLGLLAGGVSSSDSSEGKWEGDLLELEETGEEVTAHRGAQNIELQKTSFIKLWLLILYSWKFL